MLAENQLTVDQYLALDRAAEVRSEFFDGEMFAMTGASLVHNEIVGNLVEHLRPALRGQGCGVYANDLRVHVPATGLYAYPDVVIVCGEPELATAEGDVLTNPTLLIEVLSPSTEAYDRGQKFEHYRTVEALRGYVLVAQERASVEYFARQANGRWLLTACQGLDSVAELTAVQQTVALAEIYAGVSGLD